MERRAFVTGAAALLAAPRAAEAQQGKVYRVGILGESASDPAEVRAWQAFRLGLRELGWIEGKNLQIESRWAEGNSARLPGLAADLVRLKVDLIVTRGSTYVEGARKATFSIPIVFFQHADPVGTGHVASLAKPGGHITGLALMQTEIYRKEIELLIATVPAAERIAVLWNPDTPSHTPGLKTLEESARTLHVQLQPVVARSKTDFEGAFSAMARAKAQALLVLAFAPYIVERHRLAELALQQRLPTMFNTKDQAEAGGLLSYGPDLDELARRGATYVDKILKGARPGDLPVEQPTKFELVINLKTAKALGLTIPPSLLQRADQVIE
jgi:putative tryptophan/tyrosine transport system substrate-binding protein